MGIEIKKDEKEIEKWSRYWKKFLQNPIINRHNKQSVNQHKQQDLIRKAEGVTLVVCSVDMLESDLKHLRLI